MKKPIEIVFTPPATTGSMRVNVSPEAVLCSKAAGFAVPTPKRWGMLGTVDVGIHQAGPCPEMVQSEGQAGRHRAFADAPFAAADGNDVGDRESESSARVLAADLRRERRLRAARPASRLRTAQGLFDGLRHPLAMGIGGSRQLDFDVDRAVGVDPHGFEHLELSESPPDLRIDDVLKDFRNVGLSELCVCHGSSFSEFAGYGRVGPLSAAKVRHFVTGDRFGEKRDRPQVTHGPFQAGRSRPNQSR